MLNYEKYKNTLKPAPRFYNEYIELQKLQKLNELTPAQQLRVKELEDFIEEAKKQADLYDAEEKQLRDLWINDLYEEYGVKDNPKADDAYHLAYEYGHDYGYSNIENYFSDLVELIK